MKSFHVLLIVTFILIVGGMIFLLFHCKWQWADIRFEKVNSESITSIDILYAVPNSELNLTNDNIRVTSSAAIEKIVRLMRLNEEISMNHPMAYWDAKLRMNFMDQSTLKLEVVKSKNQGCLMTFCSDCFGIKNITRNDSLCDFMEELVDIFQRNNSQDTN